MISRSTRSNDDPPKHMGINAMGSKTPLKKMLLISFSFFFFTIKCTFSKNFHSLFSRILKLCLFPGLNIILNPTVHTNTFPIGMLFKYMCMCEQRSSQKHRGKDELCLQALSVFFAGMSNSAKALLEETTE